MNRTVPLLADRLPLYATRQEIAAAMVNGAREIKFALAVFNWRDFPKPNPLFGGRYFVPAVLEYLEAYEAARHEGVVRPAQREGNHARDRGSRPEMASAR